MPKSKHRKKRLSAKRSSGSGCSQQLTREEQHRKYQQVQSKAECMNEHILNGPNPGNILLSRRLRIKG